MHFQESLHVLKSFFLDEDKIIHVFIFQDPQPTKPEPKEEPVKTESAIGRIGSKGDRIVLSNPILTIR